MICGDALHRVIVDNEDWVILIIPFIILATEIFCTFTIFNDRKQNAIRDFEAGKYRKEITYKARQVKDHITVYDSTVVYEPIPYK